MPSTLVHLAIGGLVAAALLQRLGPKALAVALAATALPDLDAFAFGYHRAALHTALLPLALGGLLLWDLRVRETSALRSRYGARAGPVAGAALAALTVGGIAPDLFTNGVNLLFPLHDQYYKVAGHLHYVTDRGFVQTFVDLSAESKNVVGSTAEVHYETGVNPTPKQTKPADVERTFYVLNSGRDLVLVATSTAVLATRLWRDRQTDPQR